MATSSARLILISDVTLFPIGEPGANELSSVTFPSFGTVGSEIPLLSTVSTDSIWKPGKSVSFALIGILIISQSPA